MAKLNDQETIGEHHIPQKLPMKFQSACSDFFAQRRRSPVFVFAVDGAEDGLDCERVVFVKIDDVLAGLGELAGRQEFLDDLRLGVVDKLLASDLEVNNSLDLVMAVFTSLQRLGVLGDTQSQVMIVGDGDDSGSHADRFSSAVGRHYFGLSALKVWKGGRKGEKKGRRIRTGMMWRVSRG